MRQLTLIAAIGKNYELGKDNSLIWRFREDMKFFKKNTVGKMVVMGRKTFESLPGMLPNRKHVVLTHQDISWPDVIVLHSLNEFLDRYQAYQEEIMVIGGAYIYQEMLPYANKMLLTEIDDTCDEADAYFPYYDISEWNSKILDEHVQDGIYFSHVQYSKKLVKEKRK